MQSLKKAIIFTKEEDKKLYNEILADQVVLYTRTDGEITWFVYKCSMGRTNGYKSAPNLAEKYTTRTNSWKLNETSSKLSIRQGVFIIIFI